MVYKPVLCELKCIGRDVNKEVNNTKDAFSSVSFKNDYEDLKEISGSDWMQLIGGLAVLIGIGAVISYLIEMITLLQLIFVILVLLTVVCVIVWVLYAIGRYIKHVHQRCINHSRRT